jgi:signal transduction histidine kinase
VWIGPDGQPHQSAYAPIDLDGDGKTDLLLGVQAPAVYLDQLARLRRAFALLGLLWVCGVVVIATLVTHRVLAPIHALGDAARRLAAGEQQGTLAQAGTSEIAALQDAFVRMSAAVVQREAWLRSLAGAVAHEVRNPANALRLNLGLLAREVGRQGPAGARVSTMEGDLDQLEETVASFLAFGQTGGARRRPTGLRALLGRSAPDAAIDAPDVDVPVDPVLFERAIANLYRNARQAGGSNVVIKARIEAERLIVEVRDDGGGFARDVVDRAFEPFVTGRASGTGLGLAVVAAIADAHGGRAYVASGNAGATMVVLEARLPAT